jgi:hypothetical protein
MDWKELGNLDNDLDRDGDDDSSVDDRESMDQAEGIPGDTLLAQGPTIPTTSSCLPT